MRAVFALWPSGKVMSEATYTRLTNENLTTLMVLEQAAKAFSYINLFPFSSHDLLYYY